MKFIMKLKQLALKPIKMKHIELNFIIAVTLLSTAFLIKVWPRFRNDAMEFPLYGYLILIAFFSIMWYMVRKS
ncbi:hypothetical protein HQ529_06365 [Candidatus Woesearchaeota archaeon]|nr:hypothetical protein [Candidatus Woesearchaeota archaeon]